MNLFKIEQEYKALQELTEDIEFNPESGEIIDNSELIKQLFDELSNDKLEVKLENIMYIIKELEVSQTALKDEAKRLNEKAKVFENRSLRLKEMIKNVMIVSNQDKIKTDKFSFSVRTVEKWDYENINLFGLSDEFIRTKQEIDKTKIKEFVKAGGTIDGLRISEDTSLTVR
jgi:phage host-nuclease inhibitor protein Gam